MNKNYIDGVLAQRKQYLKQFGYEQPASKDLCQYCKMPYGEHYGSKCPQEEKV